jgi:3-oxoacyl-[acyl-carrier protein] reductase
VLARSTSELEETADQIRSSGGHASVVSADLGDRVALATAAKRILDEIGIVEILVNNAAVVWPLGPSVGIDPDEWSSAIDINVDGAVRLTFELLPAMLKRKWGRIVNVSSGIAARPEAMIGANAYATSKAALEAHTLNLAAELAGSGVTVNAYRPGTVDTEMQAWIRLQPGEQIGEALHERFVSSYEEGHLITPQDSARSLVSHLASDESGELWSFKPA